jgi:O-antigen ligase
LYDSKISGWHLIKENPISMFDILIYFVSPLLAFLAAIGVAVGLVAAIQLISRKTSFGYLSFFFYAILLKQALIVIFSNRILSSESIEHAYEVISVVNPYLELFNKLLSVGMIVVSLERIIFNLSKRDARLNDSIIWLISFFTIYWVTTVMVSALLGKYSNINHEYLYSLIFGLAALLSTFRESTKLLDAFRNSTALFLLLGFLVALVRPELVMDNHYTQGFIPGLPRFAGLSPHANSLGILSELFVLCLWLRPFISTRINRASWALGLLSIFLAQSKTVWLSFLVCISIILIAKNGPRIALVLRKGKNLTGIISIIMIISICALFFGAEIISGNTGSHLDKFLNSDEGTQIMSLTGRDKIWAIAIEEWRNNPVFGYGLTLFDARFQHSIGIPGAVHAHNQFLDTLARSGLVGATGLLAYVFALFFFSIKYFKSSNGLTFALFMALIFRSVTEVPLTLSNLGLEFIGHVLLLIVLAGQIQKSIAKKRSINIS